MAPYERRRAPRLAWLCSLPPVSLCVCLCVFACLSCLSCVRFICVFVSVRRPWRGETMPCAVPNVPSACRVGRSGVCACVASVGERGAVRREGERFHVLHFALRVLSLNGFY